MYININPVEDRRKKSDRIRQEITDLAFSGHLHSNPRFDVFNDQFCSYPDVKYDDCLDALAIALMGLEYTDIIEGEYEVIEEREYDSLEWRGCP